MIFTFMLFGIQEERLQFMLNLNNMTYSNRKHKLNAFYLGQICQELTEIEASLSRPSFNSYWYPSSARGLWLTMDVKLN